jgi:hypothetical protein
MPTTPNEIEQHEETLRRTTDDILKAEAKEIGRQRKNRLDLDKEIPVDKDAIGLSFSGGGIRSATFNLGLLQGLRDAGVLRHIDYLSTVSGGGYIGSWFTATCRRLASRKNDPKAAAFEKDHGFLEEDGQHGSPFIHHLRQYSRYLAPKAGITSGDTWTMVSIWLRNTLLIQTMVISCIALLVALVDLLPFIFHRIVGGSVAPKSQEKFWQISNHLPWYALIFAQLAFLLVIVWGCRRGIDSVNKGANTGVGASAYKSWALISGLLLAGSFLASTQLYRMAQDKYTVFWHSGVACGIHKPALMFGSWGLSPVVSIMVGVVAVLSVWLINGSLHKKDTSTVRLWNWCLGVPLQWVAGMALVEFVRHSFVVMAGGNLDENGTAISWITILGPLMIATGYCLTQVLSIGVLGRYMHERVREWWGRAGAWVIMTCVLYLIATLLSIAGPRLTQFFSGGVLSGWLSSSIVMGWVATTLIAVLAGKSKNTNDTGKGGFGEVLAANLPLIFLVGLLLIVSITVAAILAPDNSCSGFLLAQYLANSKLCICTESFPLLVSLGVLAFILAWRVDLNQFSMNPFYRNRLERCYLGGSRFAAERNPHPVTGFDFGTAEDQSPESKLGDDLLMKELCTKDDTVKFGGPFLIINTAINSGASAGLDVQDRSAESFTSTPLSAGFDHWRSALGYPQPNSPEGVKRIYHRDTSQFGAEEGWTLGRALAVSGAAASPNSGYHTSPLVAFMLTLFNARLGWWTPHPRLKSWRKSRPESMLGFFKYILQELTGSASLDSEFVYLSDGGHFENLGLYELVRRRCRIIIVGDAECDPGFTFQGLGMAIRRCRVDFGTQIEIDPDQLRPDPQTGFSKAHVAVGKIYYPASATEAKAEGILIYVKAALTGDEPRDVLQYRAENPLFPHEPTGDQFYSEAQFESYRRLGRHAARRILSPSPKVCLDQSIAQRDWSEWQEKKKSSQVPAPHQTAFHNYIEKLEKYWLPPPHVPVARFVHHAEALMDIWREAASDPELRELDELLIAGAKLVEKTEENVLLESPTPEPPSSSQTVSMPHTTTRKIAYLSQRIVQLMENVFLDLDLAYHAEHEDHQGWMAAFRFWAQNQHIQAAWEASKSTYGDRFQTFWNQQIKL